MRLLALPILVLTGCAEKPEVTCDAGRWASFVGQPEEAIYGALGNMRIIHEGQAVAQDHNPDRLNAEIGADGRITGFGCY